MTPDAKNWLIWKDPEAGKDWRREEKGMTEDKMVGWHYRRNWTWVWVNSGSWWWTGRPGVLRFMGSQRVRHDWVTELNWTLDKIVLLNLNLQNGIGKNSLPGMDWGQEEKGMTKDEMAGWHHQLDGHEFEWTPGVGEGQGGLVCFDSWGRKETDTTEWRNWTELNWEGRIGPRKWNIFMKMNSEEKCAEIQVEEALKFI